MFNKLITRMRGEFARNVAVLATGTALAQAVPVIASPILTRLYNPEDFGLLAVFTAVVSSIVPAVGGKYEVAMVLPKSEYQGRQLFGVASLVTALISMLVAVVTIACHDQIIVLLDAPLLSGWLYLVPPVLFLTGIFHITGYYANRMQCYSFLAKSKQVQALATVTVAIGLGIFGAGFPALLLANLLGLIVATIYILERYRKELFRSFIGGWRKKCLLAIRYREYPFYSATSSLLDGLTVALPVFFITSYFPESVVGYYALVLRVANAPLSFISTSISQINLKKVVDLVNEGIPVLPYLYRLAFVLAIFSAVISIAIVLIAPSLFKVVFGEAWVESGTYAQILVPALAVRFVASTISSTLGATKNNRYAAIWKVIAFISTLAVFMYFAPKGDILMLLYAAALNDVVLYSLYFGFIVRAAKYPRTVV